MASQDRRNGPTEPFKRALAGCHEDDRERAGARGHLRGRAAGRCRGNGAAAGAAAQAPPQAKSRSSAALPIRSRCGSPVMMPASIASYQPGGPASARRVRGGRAGARRGDRRAPHGGHGEQSRPPCSTTAIHAANSIEITDRADAPIEDALALMVRERLTGTRRRRRRKQARRAVAPAGSRSKAGGELDRLERR